MRGPFAGGCLCGRVRYVAEGPALFGLLCHCRDCQQVSAGGHVPIMGVRKSGFDVSGDPARSTVTGGSGQPTHRHFCRNCGSLLYGMPEAAPELVTVYVGSLDDPSAFRPTEAIHTRHRQPWDSGGTGLVAHEGAIG